MYTNKVILLLGTNLGNKNKNLENSKNLIKSNIGEIIKQTKVMETKAIEFHSENQFLNQVIEITTILSPFNVLKEIKEIEKILGRKIKLDKKQLYEDRIIDIDILFFNFIFFYSKALEIPHNKNTLHRNFSIQLLKEL